MIETKTTEVFLDSALNDPIVRVYRCQRQWDELQSSGHEDVRFCDHCRQTVHRVIDVEGFQRSVAQGQCVMVTGYADTYPTEKGFVGKADVGSYEVDTARPKAGAD